MLLKKSFMYSYEEHVISFIRFLVDYDKKEIDVACEEVAKHDSEKKYSMMKESYAERQKI